MTTMAVLALIGGVLLPLSGFFSGSEIALVSADRMKLRADAERGRRGSILALQMLQNPTRMLSTCLVGTNLVAICIATLGTQLVLTNTTVHHHPQCTSPAARLTTAAGFSVASASPKGFALPQSQELAGEAARPF